MITIRNTCPVPPYPARCPNALEFQFFKFTSDTGRLIRIKSSVRNNFCYLCVSQSLVFFSVAYCHLSFGNRLFICNCSDFPGTFGCVAPILEVLELIPSFKLLPNSHLFSRKLMWTSLLALVFVKSTVL